MSSQLICYLNNKKNLKPNNLIKIHKITIKMMKILILTKNFNKNNYNLIDKIQKIKNYY